MSRFDWPAITLGLASRFHWHPNQVMDDTSLKRLWPFLFAGGQTTTPHDPDRLRAKINRLRAAKGLPPMKPRGK